MICIRKQRERKARLRAEEYMSTRMRACVCVHTRISQFASLLCLCIVYCINYKPKHRINYTQTHTICVYVNIHTYVSASSREIVFRFPCVYTEILQFQVSQLRSKEYRLRCRRCWEENSTRGPYEENGGARKTSSWFPFFFPSKLDRSSCADSVAYPRRRRTRTSLSPTPGGRLTFRTGTCVWALSLI